MENVAKTPEQPHEGETNFELSAPPNQNFTPQTIHVRPVPERDRVRVRIVGQNPDEWATIDLTPETALEVAGLLTNVAHGLRSQAPK